MHSPATRWGKCPLIWDGKGRDKGLWYPEKPLSHWDLGLESCEGLGALEFHCFLWVGSNHERYSKKIICLKFIFESCLIQMMHPSTSHTRNQFHTSHPLKYTLYNRQRYTHTFTLVCYMEWVHSLKVLEKEFFQTHSLIDRPPERYNTALLEKYTSLFIFESCELISW